MPQKNRLKGFKFEFQRRWHKFSYKKQPFLTQNAEWLSTSIVLPSWKPGKTGRPKKDFNDCSDRSKRLKTKELRGKFLVDELAFAAQMSQRSSRNCSAADVIKLATSNPSTATEMKDAVISRKIGTNQKLSSLESLSMFVEADLTKHQYNIIRQTNKMAYSSYYKLQKEKLKCYPSTDSVTVTETTSDVRLQDLLDHTTSRLCDFLKDEISSLTDLERQTMTLLSKWGCDGSQQDQFKQKFEGSCSTDASLFQSSFVPLRLISENGNIIWQNPTPSSPRFCRPIRISFIHESTEVTIQKI